MPDSPANAAHETDQTDKVTAQLNAMILVMRAELGRADLKAQALLAGTSAILIIGVAALDNAPLAAQITGWAGVLTACVAVVLLATAIRPHLKGQFGLVKYSKMSAEEIVLDASEIASGGRNGHYSLAVEQAGMARLAQSKFRVIRRALTLLLAAGLLGLVASVLALVATT